MKKASKLTFTVPRDHVDERLDVAFFRLCQKQAPERSFSRGSASRLIREGRLFVNGHLQKPTYRVHLHDELRVTDLPGPEGGALLPNPDIRISVLVEDVALLAIDKPAGLQVHPAGREQTETLANGLLARFPELLGIGDDARRPGMVHRLDKETSGIVVVAKTEASFSALKHLFATRQVEKHYVGLVYGHLPERSGVVSKALMQPSGELKRRIIDEKVASRALQGQAKPALTTYEVLRRYQDFDLIALSPKTGRTHQIRVHMASLGHPIVGDKLYAFKKMRRSERLTPSRHLLHAFRLTFELFGRDYSFLSPLPSDFRAPLLDIDETIEESYASEALKSLNLP